MIAFHIIFTNKTMRNRQKSSSSLSLSLSLLSSRLEKSHLTENKRIDRVRAMPVANYVEDDLFSIFDDNHHRNRLIISDNYKRSLYLFSEFLIESPC